MAKDERLLTPEEVEYIAFEGGGGKGNAYLGAIKAIWEMILTKENSLKGYAGASAGAITALLLASGYSHSKIKEILSTDFNRFFDFPEADNDRVVMLSEDGGHLGAIVADDLLKVLSGGESFAGAGEVNSAHFRVVLTLVEPGLQGQGHLPVEAVVNLGAVEGDPGYMAVQFEEDTVVFFH